MATTHIRLPDGRTISVSEWIHDPIFSTVDIGAGDAIKLTAFTYTVGQQIPSTPSATPRQANTNDTNQIIQGRIGHEEAFLAYSMTYEAFATSNAETAGGTILAQAPAVLSQNLRRLERDCFIELLLGAGITKPQASCPMSWIAQGPGAVAYTSGDAPAAGTAISYGTSGNPSPMSQRNWPLPIGFASDRVMRLKMTSFPGAVTDLSQDISIRWYIDGLRRRPVR